MLISYILEVRDTGGKETRLGQSLAWPSPRRKVVRMLERLGKGTVMGNIGRGHEMVMGLLG